MKFPYVAFGVIVVGILGTILFWVIIGAALLKYLLS